MKKLTITTERYFESDKAWEDYKNWYKSNSLSLDLSFADLEKKGRVRLSQSEPGELVLTTYRLENNLSLGE
jgi:hypothetical protein